MCLLVTLVVLTRQNRQAAHAQTRAQLDLQLHLVQEQKTAKLIALVEEFRRDLPGVRRRRDPVAEAMTIQVDAHRVMEVLEDTLDTHLLDEEHTPNGRASET